ncbi:MAG TPA: hypothetical protein VGF13_11540, partial [Verrucomicrobiae bacterium]
MHGSLTPRFSLAIVRDQKKPEDRQQKNVAAKDDYLIDTLIDLGYVTHDQVASVQPDSESSGEGVVDLLVT